VLAFFASTIAHATDHHLGVIKSLDVFARQVVLEDGTAYPVVRGINLGRFKPGDKVVLETEDRKGMETVTKLGKGERIPILIPGQPRTHVP
jgi:hypothetical protein